MRTLSKLFLLAALTGCGGSPDFYEEDGQCWARTYFNGHVVVYTEDYTAYPGPCE